MPACTRNESESFGAGCRRCRYSTLEYLVRWCGLASRRVIFYEKCEIVHVAADGSSPDPAGLPRFCQDNGIRAFAGQYCDSFPDPRAGSDKSLGELTNIFAAMQRGEPIATERLLPLVYDELKMLAAQRLAHEPAGGTLQATALVHEAYLRLSGSNPEAPVVWNGRGHFFAAASEAMRRILIDAARRRRALKRGGSATRQDLEQFADRTPIRVD